MAAHFDRQSIDGVFRALADPGRRRLLDSLNGRNGQTLRELCTGMDMARQSVSKHLAVLEAANLVTTVWRGREKLHYLNPAPITDISERWINSYEQDRVHALADLKRALEDPTMDRPSFVYTTYIQTTPEQLWEALTSPAFTERYWGMTFDTDWEPGSEMTWSRQGLRISDPEQVVIESDPYRRLAFTWHTFVQELAKTGGVSADDLAAAAQEPRSKVTFELEPAGGAVKLTVVHDGFPPVSRAAELVSHGWPQVLSGLKTLLETGETISIEPGTATGSVAR